MDGIWRAHSTRKQIVRGLQAIVRARQHGEDREPDLSTDLKCLAQLADHGLWHRRDFTDRTSIDYGFRR